MEEDLVGARELLRFRALDERFGVPDHADEDLVQLELIERPFAALDRRRHAGARLDDLLDLLQAVQAKVRLDPCNDNTYSMVMISFPRKRQP